MSFCPICGRAYCDHTPAERGQTREEMMRDLIPEEQEAFGNNDDAKKLELGRRNAHLPTQAKLTVIRPVGDPVKTRKKHGPNKNSVEEFKPGKRLKVELSGMIAVIEETQPGHIRIDCFEGKYWIRMCSIELAPDGTAVFDASESNYQPAE